MKWIIQSFVLGFLLISSAAQAESQLDLTITRLTPITASSPLSGTDIVYEVLFQCSAVNDVECKNSVIKIGPLPYEIDTAEVAPHPLIANSSFTRGTQGAAADGFITINLKQTVWAGSSIAFGVTLTTINGRTPNGFTWDVTATATASNANDSTDAADGKAYANSEIKVKKSVLPKRPVVDRTARYNIHSCADGTSHVGWLVLEDSLLVDTLPADVEYIGSSNGGVYDAAANTVTWSGFTLEPCEDTWIDVVFPSAIFGKTAPKITLATNNVTLSALPFAETERVTDDALVNHRFLDAIPNTTTGEIQKSVNKEWTYPWRAEESQIVWSIPFVNKGTLPTALELNDRLPCAYAANGRGVHTSPLMDETLCTDPSFITESITLGDTYTAAVAAGYSPVWTSNSGNTGTFTGSADSMTPAGLPQGDVIAEIKLPADSTILFSAAEWPITTKVHSVVQIKGRMNEKDTSSGAESTWVALTKIINREDHRLYGTGTTPITDWNSSTANVTVGKTGPLGSIYKDMARGGQNGSFTTDIVKIQAKKA